MAAFNFGEVILQALANEKAKQMQKEQFDKQMALDTRRTDIQENQWNLQHALEKEKWLEGESKLIQAQIAKLQAEGKAIPEELRLKAVALDNEMTMHKERLAQNYDIAKMNDDTQRFGIRTNAATAANNLNFNKSIYRTTQFDPNTNGYKTVDYYGNESPYVDAGTYDKMREWANPVTAYKDGEPVTIGGGQAFNYLGANPVVTAVNNVNTNNTNNKKYEYYNINKLLRYGK